MGETRAGHRNRRRARRVTRAGRRFHTPVPRASAAFRAAKRRPMGPQIVWFKRDLRVDDHAALDGACRAGPTIGIYVFEPEVLRLPDSDPCHVAFVRSCVASTSR